MNSSHLLSTASAQRQATARDAVNPNATAEQQQDSSASTFIRQLEGRLFSALAGQVTEAIFGDNPQDSGSVVFGTTTVTFDRSSTEIRLSIADSLDGSVTEIVVPQLVVN